MFPEQVAANLDKSFMVRFVDESDALIAPGFRWGTILRSNPVRSECVVAVQFRPPLPPALMGTLLGAHLAPAKLV